MLAKLYDENLFRVVVANQSTKLNQPVGAVLDIQVDVFWGLPIGARPLRRVDFSRQGEYSEVFAFKIAPHMVGTASNFYWAKEALYGEIIVTVRGPEGQLIASRTEWIGLAQNPIFPEFEAVYQLSSPTSSQVLGAVQSAIADGSYSDIAVTDGPWGVDATVNTSSIAAAAELSGMSVADWGSQYGFW